MSTFEDLENIGTPIIVLNEENKLLLGKRINAYKSGFYGMPGGRAKVGEKLLDAVKRELIEETGLQANSTELVGVVRENQGSYSFVHFGFIIKEATGNLENKEPHKCEGWDWYSLDNLPKEILPGHKAIIEMYLDQSSPRFRDIV